MKNFRVLQGSNQEGTTGVDLVLTHPAGVLVTNDTDGTLPTR